MRPSHALHRFRPNKMSIPASGIVLLSGISTQVGSALATRLFVHVGPSGAVSLRVGFAAILLLFGLRPTLRGYSKRAYLQAMLFGIALGAMNLCFYLAISRIPLGIAVTAEFVGPLGVAIVGSRKWTDMLWVLLAGTGVALLTPQSHTPTHLAGLGFALLAGACWALYIVFSARVGQSIPGLSGLALAFITASVLLVPFGVLQHRHVLFQPVVLGLGLCVAVLSSLIPYSLELQALRRMPTRTFGLWMSTEPGIAAVMGWLILHQGLGTRAIVAILCITAATAGSTWLQFSSSATKPANAKTNGEFQ